MSAKKFYAQRDDLGFVIPGTMMAASRVPSVRNVVEIPAQTVVAIGQQVVVKHPEGLRFFVRRRTDGRIIPNSLMASLQPPAGLYYEWRLVR